MKDRIRYSLIYMGVIAALLAVFFTVRVFEDEMADQLKVHLRENLRLIETAYIDESLESKPQNLARFASADLRITLIDQSQFRFHAEEYIEQATVETVQKAMKAKKKKKK